jgi:tetrathionate reductase subunit B
MRKYALLINNELCWGCKTCEVACKQENRTAEGVKRADGIVVMDDSLCTGCQACIEACPYDAIDFDHQKGIAQKCNLCHHRVDYGLIPACADNVCLAHCIYFGETIQNK